MSISQLNTGIILNIISNLPDRFHTKDVSSHPDAINNHSELFKHRNYHSFVGKFLKKLKDQNGYPVLIELEKNTSKGSLWLKAAPDSNGEEKVLSNNKLSTKSDAFSDQDNFGIGPQCSSDKSFTAIMRHHQSWYRSEILKLPFGTGPTKMTDRTYGNMLKAIDGFSGANFLNEKIYEAVKERLSLQSGAVESFRLLNNMLSSQPMCFNLFGMMKEDKDLATEFWKFHFPDIHKITDLKFEYAPEPKWKYLDDKTAFDVYFEYINRNGEKGFIAIETKLTESFSPKVYDTAVYRKWTEMSDVPWRKESLQMLQRTEHNQLWRDHLLAVSILKQPDSEFKEFKFLLVSHPQDNDCKSITNNYKNFLRPDYQSFFHIHLDELLIPYDNMKVDDEVNEWFGKFRLRYLDLEKSENYI